MKSLGIRSRILLTVLGPAILMAVLVTGLLVIGQMRQTEAEQHRRLAAVARQLSALAEYNLFVGNNEALRNLLKVANSEPDVLAAAFLDTRGHVLASTLPPDQLPPAEQILESFVMAGNRVGVEHWHALPIRATRLASADLYASTPDVDAPPLGQLLLKVSTKALHEETAAFAVKAAGISALMLLLVVLLAIAFSRGLIRTLTDIGHVVEGIGRGKHDLRVKPHGHDELGKLAEGINAMAAAVGQTQEQLAERIIEATATLRHERDEADHTARARSRFFAAASHDLRQPAQALGLFVARLQRENLAPDLQPKLGQLAQTVSNLQGLLGTLLDYSRLDGQVLRVESRPVQATQAIGQVVNSFAEAAAAKQVRLRSRIHDCWLLTDPALLHRILINLIGNAVKHTSNGSILVTCRRGTGQARIEVWDTGPGIPPEARETIFDELVQLDNPERDAEKGLGLGLAIVRKSANLLGHPLSLCSRVGQGSRFALSVPLTVPGAAEEAIPRGKPTAEHTPALLVGPARPELDELTALLESWQFSVQYAPTFTEAWSSLSADDPPQFVIFDLSAGSAEVANSLDWMNRVAAKLGHELPALIICSGPVPALGEQPGKAPRLLLTRPFRPARLRALIGRLQTHPDDLPD
ncbi:MAG: ATP-binding protein [Pseudomonadota bacterium]